MALSVQSPFGTLMFKLEQLQEQGYYYAGEVVLTGAHQDKKPVDVQAFHLWHLAYQEKLERIVMLFLDLSLKKAATVVIEGKRVFCEENTNVSFQIEMFKMLTSSVRAYPAEKLACESITDTVRVIYPRPLYWQLLYRCNLLLVGHNFSALCGDGAALRDAEVRKDKLLLENIRRELRDYFELDQWEEQADFGVSRRAYDDLTRQICELSNCLEGLQVIREGLTEDDKPDSDMPGMVSVKKRCRRIDDMICVTQSSLQQLIRSAGSKIPFADPMHTIALWRIKGSFPENMSIGEMVSIRTQLECIWDTLHQGEPSKDIPKRHALWEHRMGNIFQQICQLDDLLSTKLEEDALKWEDYLV